MPPRAPPADTTSCLSIIQTETLPARSPRCALSDEGASSGDGGEHILETGTRPARAAEAPARRLGGRGGRADARLAHPLHAILPAGPRRRLGGARRALGARA